MLTSSPASKMTFALIDFAGLSSEVVVRRHALVTLKVIVLCCDLICIIGLETLRRLGAGNFAIASRIYKSTG